MLRDIQKVKICLPRFHWEMRTILGMGQEAANLGCILKKSLAALSLGSENWSESEFKSND